MAVMHVVGVAAALHGVVTARAVMPMLVGTFRQHPDHASTGSEPDHAARGTSKLSSRAAQPVLELQQGTGRDCALDYYPPRPQPPHLQPKPSARRVVSTGRFIMGVPSREDYPSRTHSRDRPCGIRSLIGACRRVAPRLLSVALPPQGSVSRLPLKAFRREPDISQQKWTDLKEEV
jgi:hypothetical protein